MIAKYGAAAHLALLATAPLFLFPFFGESTVAVVLLWLSVPAALWCLLQPSLRQGEGLSQARHRVFHYILTDPLFWALLVVAAMAGARALNAGIDLAYNAEISKWYVKEPPLVFFPGCVGAAGHLPFAAAVALLVLIEGCGHSLGRSARYAFLLLLCFLSGVAAALAIVAIAYGNAAVLETMACLPTKSFHVGLSFAVCLMGGTVGLVAAFERHWYLATPLCIIGIAGASAGAFAFAPPIVLAIVAAAEILLVAYVFFYSVKYLPTSGEFKYLVALGIALTLGGLLAVAILPAAAVNGRVAAFTSVRFVTPEFLELRSALSEVARKAWFSHLWTGSGIASFPIDFRFAADERLWQLVKTETVDLPNGWWQLLAERGLVGALMLALPVGFIAYTFVRRFVNTLLARDYPHPAGILLLLTLLAGGAAGAFSCAVLRPDAMIVSGAMLALSANSLNHRRGRRNG